MQDNLFSFGIMNKVDEICQALQALSLDEQVNMLNKIRERLHEAGPFKNEPVDCVQWVPVENVHANDYNPNSVAPPEMKLLKLSVRSDGFTQPVVAWRNGNIEVVDGFHRTRVAKDDSQIHARLHGYLPVSFINSGRTGRRDRIAATIRHNRARGVHGVSPMTDIVADLLRQGWTDNEIANELGMDADEVLRFKQNTGMAELFKDVNYSRAWE